jgi:Ca2+-transporting ATPase
VHLDHGRRERLGAANLSMAAQALRVIAIASKTVPHGTTAIQDADLESGLTVLGLVGMMDPPRHGVRQAVLRAKAAGIRVMMLTGDQKATAVAVGREIGLLGADQEHADVFTEHEAAAMDDAAFARAVGHAVIFARVSPETKLRIVSALQAAGRTVVMTGDGVNDAPALKKASAGVAMGITGTDVSKDVADMVLTDDDFTSIVNAVEEGRTVFRNVQQTTGYLFMTNVGEALTLITAIAIGLPLPLLPAQVLWMNLVTDGLPDMALAAEPGDAEVLDAPPRASHAPILSREIMLLSVITSALMCAGTLGLFVWAQRRGGVAYARTVAFTVMAMFQLWNVFNMRSLRRSLFSVNLGSNPYVLAAIGAAITLQMAVLYVPGLRIIFGTVPLGLLEWCGIIAISSTVFFAVEGWKWMRGQE